MLLRGVVLPKRALDQTDIETTKARAARSGRSYGGTPFRGNGGDRGRDSFNYAAPNSYSRPPNQNHQSYGDQIGYNSHHYPQQHPSSWQPPPPGVTGFARSPPPPPNLYSSYSQSRQAQSAPASYDGQYQRPMPPFGGYEGAYGHRNDGNGSSNHGPPGYGRY